MSGVTVYLLVFFIIAVRFVLSGNKKGGGSGRTGAGRSSVGKKGFSDTRPDRGGAFGSGQAQRGPQAGRGPLASDGHRVPKDQDVSCRRFGHRHEEFDTARYIPHSDPEQGYIILNGVKMRLRDADRYEDSI